MSAFLIIVPLMLSTYSRTITFYQMCFTAPLPSLFLEMCQPCYMLPQQYLWKWLGILASHLCPLLSLATESRDVPKQGLLRQKKDFFFFFFFNCSVVWKFVLPASVSYNVGGFTCSSYVVWRASESGSVFLIVATSDVTFNLGTVVYVLLIYRRQNLLKIKVNYFSSYCCITWMKLSHSGNYLWRSWPNKVC